MTLPESNWSRRNPGAPPEIARVPLHERVTRAVTKVFDRYREEGEPHKPTDTPEERKRRAEEHRIQADALERQ